MTTLDPRYKLVYEKFKEVLTYDKFIEILNQPHSCGAEGSLTRLAYMGSIHFEIAQEANTIFLTHYVDDNKDVKKNEPITYFKLTYRRPIRSQQEQQT